MHAAHNTPVKKQTQQTLLTFCAVVIAIAGCSESNFGQVQGIVTLDGKPVANATVEFQPLKGSPSFGETDAQGKFKLMYSPSKPGASVGVHKVRISTFRIEGDGPNKVTIPERIPAEYNEKSITVHEVKPGRQTRNFEILTVQR